MLKNVFLLASRCFVELPPFITERIRPKYTRRFISIYTLSGCDIAAFVSYGEVKRTSKHPEKFGTGILEGVAAPEAGNNAATGGAMIPMLTLGVPGDAVTAVLLGALTIHGFQPGPMLFRDHLDKEE
ncbi:MAG: tripartite tricarboxylate transporter permease [bacterium]|nr:tripartite tricarboxylate transporter permease [bacterium]